MWLVRNVLSSAGLSLDRKSTRLNSSHEWNSYAVFCLKKKLRRMMRKDPFRRRLFVVVSNREPYLHTRNERGLQVIRPASGMATAVDPLIQATGGLRVSHGSGDADAEVCDEAGRVSVPPEKPSYTLKRVWLTKEQEAGYYDGFANSAVWPLFFIASPPPKIYTLSLHDALPI